MRILLIDDDPLILDSLAEILTFDGHEVSIADGGQTALTKFRSALSVDAPFEVVITDLAMPLLNGIDLAAEVRAHSSTVLIILLTGWGERAREQHELPACIDHLLPKPIRIGELRAALLRHPPASQEDG